MHVFAHSEAFDEANCRSQCRCEGGRQSFLVVQEDRHRDQPERVPRRQDRQRQGAHRVRTRITFYITRLTKQNSQPRIFHNWFNRIQWHLKIINIKVSNCVLEIEQIHQKHCLEKLMKPENVESGSWRQWVKKDVERFTCSFCKQFSQFNFNFPENVSLSSYCQIEPR